MKIKLYLYIKTFLFIIINLSIKGQIIIDPLSIPEKSMINNDQYFNSNIKFSNNFENIAKQTQYPSNLCVVTELPNLPNSENFQNDEKVSHDKSGYQNITELNIGMWPRLFGDQQYSLMFGFHTINGYKFNSYFSLGLGIGAGYYYARYGNSTFDYPLFINFRAVLNENKVSPYFDMSIGTSFNEEFETIGTIYNPSIGLIFKIAKQTCFNFSLGYRQQSDNIPLVNLKLGFTF